ncbi:leucyl aminopeptidase [Flavobacterium fryxellicola]|uniref:Leucyl aminopeptidase n=1 Tax=Flavobacterium fryxellicola TaxID=249352 RepID=A0A167YK65_9FLAO|nr:leucyl aminopeptidase family protein [Flavobacterium fryxellicola]OAB29505.1 leucyl aminopeptidase [Flavobacterium fryxellicola]SHN71302.1 leucyl aminopeptidase [Flavobacterium fryxellicola]
MITNTIQNTDDFSGTILIPVFETYEKSIVPIAYNGLEISSKLFYGKKDTHYVAEKNEATYIFIGLGKAIDYRSLKTIFRRISSKHKELFSSNIALVVPEQCIENQVEAIVSGLLLGTYNLGHFKIDKDEHPFLAIDFTLSLVTNQDFLAAAKKGIKIAKAQLSTFTLVDLPPNTVTPKYLANWAKESGAKYGFEVEILGYEASKIAGLGAFLAVGKGSENEPQFIIMNYTPNAVVGKMKHVGLVGKGITFDTGGLNIKSAGMVHMKCDMAGGGAVFGAMQLIADLQLPIKVTAIVPCAENSVDAKSFLPSDVIHSYSGHSIEIIDTDAEGRLILADGLSYLIKNFKPEYIVDIATLTGSSVGTFGYECGALFTNNQEMAKKLQESGDAVGERLWPLPLWDEYKSDIASDIADVKNYSGKPVAGAISAAKFLEFFTKEHKAWAHLDIAGVAFGDDEFAKSKHATGYGVHLLTKFIENL